MSEGLSDIAPPDLVIARDALFLDLDGTLVEIAEDPAAVRMNNEACLMLRALNDRVSGALAVLTGRALDAADGITGATIVPIGALHGLHIRGATGDMLAQPAPLAQLRELAANIAAEIARGSLNARLEDKGASIALHYRHAPDEEARICAFARAAAEKIGLRTLKGKLVIEILPLGAAKGDALRIFMQTPPFAGRAPIAVGDDITDESAFAAANALGGASILVGPPRITAARYRLESVNAVHAWLSRGLEAAR